MVCAESEFLVEGSQSDAGRSAVFLEDDAASARLPWDVSECLHAVRQLLPVELDVLCLRVWDLSADGSTLALKAAIGPIVPFEGLGEHVPTDGSELGAVLRTGTPYVVADLQAAAPPDVRCWADANSLTSFAAVPVRVDQQAVGVLAAFCRAPLPEHHLRELQQLAALIAPRLRKESPDASAPGSENLLLSLIQCLPSAVITLDRHGLITRWNASAEHLFGWSDAEVCGRPLPFVLDERKEEFLHNPLEPATSGRVRRSRTACRRADGSVIAVQRSTSLVYDQSGEVSGRVEVFVDESPRIRTSSCLHVQSQLTRIVTGCRTIEEAAPLLLAAVGEWLACEAAEFWALDDDRRTLSRREVWARSSADRSRLAASQVRLQADAHAWPATALQSRRPVYTEKIACSAASALSPGQGPLRLPVSGLAIPIRTADAALGVITCLGTAIQSPDELSQQTLAAVADAVAELMVRVRTQAALAQSEASLRQTQKMDAIGLLAGGVAHDFNNLLTIILAYSEMGLGEIEEAHPLYELFAEIQAAGERAAAMTRQLLSISRQQPAQMCTVDLNRLVEEMERMLARLIGPSITLRVDAADGLWCVEADRNQMEQVLLNLVVNARDAMPAGGEIVVGTRNATLGHEDVLPHQARPGAWVELCVRDNGCGMDAATRARIFEPFFTTKETGRGTGMGMATVFGIVRQAGGFLRVDSDVGVGTAVCVYLPRSSRSLRVRTVNEKPQHSPRGTERVLVVENDAAVRQLIRRLLEVRGYAVDEAAHGAEALEILAHDNHGIALVLTEIQVPVVDGPTLVRRLQQLSPTTRVLLMSGTAEPPPGIAGESAVPLLSKPFTSDALALTVRSVLDSQPTPAIP